MKTAITEMKHTPERINNRLDNIEEQIYGLKKEVVEISEAEQKKKKEFKEMREVLENSLTASSILTLAF